MINKKLIQLEINKALESFKKAEYQDAIHILKNIEHVEVKLQKNTRKPICVKSFQHVLKYYRK